MDGFGQIYRCFIYHCYWIVYYSHWYYNYPWYILTDFNYLGAFRARTGAYFAVGGGGELRIVTLSYSCI